MKKRLIMHIIARAFLILLPMHGCTIGDLFQTGPEPVDKDFQAAVTVRSEERHLDPSFFAGTRTEFLLDADNHPVAVIEYSLAAESPLITRYREYKRRGDTVRVDSFVTFGADSVWLTSDDLTTGTTDYYIYSGERIIQKVSLSSFGSEYEQEWQTYDYDDTGRLIELRQYCCILVDGNRFPEILADRPALQERIRTYEYSADMLTDTETVGSMDTIREWEFSGGYFDRVALYADGSIDSTATFDYDDDGRLIRIVRFSGPGADAIWYTSDDTIDNYRAFSFNSDGSLFRDESFLVNTGCDSSGPDDQFLTGDDLACYTTDYNYSMPVTQPGYVFFIREPFINPDVFWDSL